MSPDPWRPARTIDLNRLPEGQWVWRCGWCFFRTSCPLARQIVPERRCSLLKLRIAPSTRRRGKP